MLGRMKLPHPCDIIDSIVEAVLMHGITNMTPTQERIFLALVQDGVITPNGEEVLIAIFTPAELPYYNWLKSRGVTPTGLKPSDKPDELFMFRIPDSNEWIYVDQDEYDAYTGNMSQGHDPVYN